MQLDIDKKLHKRYITYKSCKNATQKSAFLRMEEKVC